MISPLATLKRPQIVEYALLPVSLRAMPDSPITTYVHQISEQY